MLPKLFIGSSSEAGAVVDELKKQLSSIVDLVDWRADVFEVSGTTAQSILTSLKSCDFSAFIFAKDDKMKSRNVRYSSARDNTIFEAGISFGVIKPERTFIIPEGSSLPLSKRAGEKLKIMSDLSGFTLTKAYNPSDLANTIQDAVKQISARVIRLGFRSKSDILQNRDDIKNNTVSQVATASKNLLFIGRDLSWASDYVDVIEDRIKSNVDVRVYCVKPRTQLAEDNVKLLMSKGANVFYSKEEIGLRLTMIDYQNQATCRFLLSEKEWVGGEYAYRCEIHAGNGSPMMWNTLVEHCKLIENAGWITRAT